MTTARALQNSLLAIAVLGARGVADEIPHLKPTLTKYCVSCHGRNKPQGDVRLDNFDPSDTELASEIARVISDGVMPPKGKPRPDDALRKTIVRELQALVDPVSYTHLTLPTICSV